MAAKKVHYELDTLPMCQTKRSKDPVVTVNQDLVTCDECKTLMPPKPIAT